MDPAVKIFFSAFIFVLANISIAFSTPLELSSGFYAESGKTLYENGQNEAAIVEFHKALATDPSNSEAIKYLDKLGVSAKTLSEPESNPLKIAKLSQEVKVYQNKLTEAAEAHEQTLQENHQLAFEKEQLCEIAESKAVEADIANIEVDILKNEMKDTVHKQAKYKKLNTIKEEEIGFLERMVHQHKDLVVERDDLIAEKEDELTEKDEQIDLVKNISHQEILKAEDARLRDKNKYKEQMTQLIEDTETQLAFASGTGLAPDTKTALSPDSDLQEKVELLKKKDNDIAFLKEKLVDARRQISQLEKKSMGAAEVEQVEELKSHVDNIQEELDKKNLSLSAQENDISLLQERLDDAQEQLSLVQSIVEEKEDQIEALETEVKQIRQRCQ